MPSSTCWEGFTLPRAVWLEEALPSSVPSRSELEEIQPPLVSSSVQKCQALGNSRAQKRLSPELGRNEAKMLARERDEQSQREPVWHGTGF